MSSYLEVINLPSDQNKRYEALRDAFIQKYGKEPIFYGRAPGRVNLIGEHIDYCGYSVLPMAVTQDIVIAVAGNDKNEIRLSNVNKDFSDFSCPVDNYAINKISPLWYHYFLCGYRGAIEHFDIKDMKGLDLMMDGTVPKSAGLSSSSAFVVCAAIVTIHFYGKKITKKMLAELCQHSEYYIGTEGGGMDQAISVMAEAGKAKLVEFNPLKTTNVSLPDDAVFVISNSCVEMNKAGTNHFNTRVAECRLGSHILAKLCNLEGSWKDYKKPISVQQKLNFSFEQMIDLAEKKFHKGAYSKSEICSILETTEDDLNTTSLSERTYNVEFFHLYDRILHVYNESARVLKFKEVCDSGRDNILKELGTLMNESFSSCKDLYDCSCDELNELVQVCRESGAVGSRLTGAGWGGCVVSLVAKDDVDQFIHSVSEIFYKKSQHRMLMMTYALFSTKPGDGAKVYTEKL